MTVKSLLRLASLPLCLFTSIFFLGGCVPVPEGALKDLAPAAQANEPPYKGLGPGHKTYESAHFLVKAYATETAVAHSVVCEETYNRIMNDIGLYSFAPVKPYNVVVYKNADEYLAQTGQPRWSGGVAYGNAILIYESESSAAVLAHEMTHLIFNEFMGLANSAEFKWVNEGVAVHEETRASPVSRNFYRERVSALVTPNPIPFSQMINLAPQGEQIAGVERWYAQAGSVISFMIRDGGSLGFSIFISRLKAGDTSDAAAAQAFPGLWNNMGDIEKAWLLSVKS
ncbi:MAG: hypothetical protein A2X28_05795 [Elusimicrobia bacterium GWA2_56_46]|nr:MAG: hypothetical protein A2X28_05795 [Elusimicrobia bacterium GWA2_56_46]OGR56009.1 MAG: hypothetical protein A2X39_03105 [Elusimicrobia bacterium GWC2_56_31]HBB68148.1 hypothetical protein [Elusimicrobiota bacterium]HBW23253.1 hypothetical protein [Elusimicrobiota bacterium]